MIDSKKELKKLKETFDGIQHAIEVIEAVEAAESAIKKLGPEKVALEAEVANLKAQAEAARKGLEEQTKAAADRAKAKEDEAAERIAKRMAEAEEKLEAIAKAGSEHRGSGEASSSVVAQAQKELAAIHAERDMIKEELEKLRATVKTLVGVS